MIINSIYVFKKSVKTYNKTLNTQNTQSSNNDNFLTNYTWVDFNLYQNMVTLWWLEGIGPSCVTEKKFLLTTKGSGLFVLVWGKKMFHVNGLLNMIWPLFNRMGVKGKSDQFVYMFVFVVSWQFVYNALCTFHGFLFSDFYTYR